MEYRPLRPAHPIERILDVAQAANLNPEMEARRFPRSCPLNNARTASKPKHAAGTTDDLGRECRLLGPKRQLARLRPAGLSSALKLRQLGHIGGDAPGLVAGEQLGSRATARASGRWPCDDLWEKRFRN